ncbi:MAG: hypothetical protein WDW38_009360 [Sanguina aurantia]
MSLIKTMTTQLFEKERIRTTLGKALNIGRYAQNVIQLGKKGTPEAWSEARGIVKTDRELHKLFTTFAMRYKDRLGGYTRVVRCGFREKDGAPLAFVELVDRPGELRPSRPPVQAIDPFSVEHWVKSHTGGLRAQPGPVLPFALQGFLRQQQQRFHQQPQQQ